MEFYYINLAAQSQRRAHVEANFAAYNYSSWRLRRIEAVTTEFVQAKRIAGGASDAEKACFLSHVAAISASRATDGHAFVAEDDICLGQYSTRRVEQILTTLSHDQWDLIYTDLCVPSADVMIELFKMRQALLSESSFRLVDLSAIRFAGSTAYIVNGNSKARLLELISSGRPLDRPYDLHLRHLAHSGRVRAFAAFPFLTSLSVWADTSQVQREIGWTTDAVWNAYRRLVWCERDLASVLAWLGKTNPCPACGEIEAMRQILAAMLEPSYALK